MSQLFQSIRVLKIHLHIINYKSGAMKIMFDSNVWQIVAIPNDFTDEPFLADFRKIRQAIIDKKITPFISETVFTIEAIRKVERQDFFSKQKPKFSVKEVAHGNTISMSFKIGPNEKDAIDFHDRPKLKKYFDEAIGLGFNIARLPRIGGLVNKEIEQEIYHLDDTALSQYHDKVFEVAGKIEDNGGGMKQIETIGLQYGGPNWFKGLKNARQSK